MKRISDAFVRPGWVEKIISEGLIYSPTPTGEPNGSIMQYWHEGVYYSFTLEEIEYLEKAAAEIFEMCVEAGDYIIQHPHIMKKMGIPKWAWPQIIKTWNEEPACQSVYARYDVRFGGLDHPDPKLRVPKVYEFNADTPTSLLESAWVQWSWLSDTSQGTDQWNRLWEALVEAWKRNLDLITSKLGHKPVVYFACSNEEQSGEDILNTVYLEDACQAAGYSTRRIFIEDIVKGELDGRFYNYNKTEHIDVIFKLYPWEFMVGEDYGRDAFNDMANVGLRDFNNDYIGGTVWIEPPYKMLWSNKGLMAVLWKLFKNDPEKSKYLIPSWFEDEAPMRRLKEYVRKPLLGREGANVTIVRDGQSVTEIPGEYGDEGWIIQEFAPLPGFDDDNQTWHPVLGIWMIDGEPAGMGIRESLGYVTDNVSHFAPHSISDSPNPIVPSEPSGSFEREGWDNPPSSPQPTNQFPSYADYVGRKA